MPAAAALVGATCTTTLSLASVGELRPLSPRRPAQWSWAAPAATPRRRPSTRARRAPHTLAPQAAVVERVGLTVDDFNDLIKASPIPVFVDFYASWCGPCKLLAHSMRKLEPTMRGTVAFEKIDGAQNLAVVQHFLVKKLPTVVLFEGRGSTQAVARNTGNLSTQDLELWLRINLAKLKPAAGTPK